MKSVKRKSNNPSIRRHVQAATERVLERISAVDLFCGAGGLTCGLRSAGIHVALGVDVDESCRFAFESNNPGAEFLSTDVSDLRANAVKRAFGAGSIRLLAGCAPCQPFSTYSQGKRVSEDGRWRLLDHFSRIACEVLPELVTMENVPQLADNVVFAEFTRALEAHGYGVWFDTVNCAEFGVPQQRKRLVLLATRLSKTPPQLSATFRAPRSVQDAIAGLPRLAAGQSSASDSLHRCSQLSPTNLKRIRHSRPRGTWKDWPKDLLLPCHRRATGDGYTAIYGRMDWKEPAPTITTQCYNYGSGRFGHPEQDRAISLREAALIQSFPASYRFEPENARLGLKEIGRMIGNAVPPLLASAIGEAFVRHVRSCQR